MQTNTDKARIYRYNDKPIREDRKRDKYSAKEQRKRNRSTKLRSRELE